MSTMIFFSIDMRHNDRHGTILDDLNAKEHRHWLFDERFPLQIGHQ